MRRLTKKQLESLREMSRILTISELNRVRSDWRKQELPAHVNSRFYNIEYPRPDSMMRDLLDEME